MKSQRLLSILLLLQTRGLVSASELAERLEVSVRTIYRDVEALSTSGVPVYAERGRHGGIALLPGFRTDMTGLTEDESRALFLLAAKGTHSALGLDQALASALRKVMAALPEAHRPAAELTSRRILVDPSRWLAPQPAVDLDVLNSAVFTDRRLRLLYRPRDAKEPRDYLLDPYGLVVKAGVWYLVADKAGEPRMFRADRVCSAAVVDEPVRRRPGLELVDVWDSLRCTSWERAPEVRVTALVRTSALGRFLSLHPGGVAKGPVQDGPDGEWSRLELDFLYLDDVCALLAHGADVRVLEPAEARERVARSAAAVAELYAAVGTSPAVASPIVPT